MTKIKRTSVLGSGEPDTNVSDLPLPVTGSIYSLQQIVSKINAHDNDFLKYIPDRMLSVEQIAAKKEAKALEKAKIERLRNEEKKLSDRDGESVSNRSLLANALESAAQTHWERKKLREYRENIDLINSEEKKLRELNRQIRAEKDSEKKRKLRDAATETANRINVYDGILLRLEATQPIQDVLSRERKAAYDRGVQREKKALEAYREKAEKRQQEIIDRYEKSRAAYRERAEKREREIIERHKESRKRDAENRHKAEMR